MSEMGGLINLDNGLNTTIANGLYVRKTGDTMTGNLVIDSLEPTISFVNETLGVTAVFRSTYFQVEDDVAFSGLHAFYKATQFTLADDGGTQRSSVISDGISMAFYPEITQSSGMTLSANSLDLSGTDPGLFITDNGGGSAVFYYNRFQFSNFFSSYFAEISSDGLNYLEIRPSSNDDVQYRFTNQGVLQSIGANGSPFQFRGKDALAGTNVAGGSVRITTGSSKGNGVASVATYATGGGSSGSSTQNPNLVSTAIYNLINDVVDHYITKSSPKYHLDESATSGLVATFEIDRLKLSDQVDFSTIYYGDGSVARILPSYNLTINSGHEFTGTGGGVGALTYKGAVAIATNGYGYTIQADSPISGTNLNGGSLNLKSGQVTGNGTADVVVFPTGGNASGTTQYDPVETCRFAYNTTTIGPAGDIILGDSTLRTMYPQTTAKIDLGNSSNTFNDCYFGQITITEAKNIILGTTTGTKIGTSTSQKLSFYNSTPIVQPGATTDLGTVLSNLGLRASGTAYPITTSGAVNFTGGLTIATTNLTITDKDIALGTTTGTKFGTSTTQKLSFYNATPIVQITTGVASSTRTGGGGTTLTDTDTFDGYTVAQIVKSLRNLGFLA